MLIAWAKVAASSLRRCDAATAAPIDPTIPGE
jgi:hypothetical protein